LNLNYASEKFATFDSSFCLMTLRLKMGERKIIVLTAPHLCIKQCSTGSIIANEDKYCLGKKKTDSSNTTSCKIAL
jgi:hypothetical protein